LSRQRHVREDRLLAQIEADHLRDMEVGRLVIGDAVADGVADRHVAGARRAQQAGDAEHAVGAEGLGIEEVVVDAAVDHMHRDRPGGILHEYAVAVHIEVATLDQLGAHAGGEEAVLEVGAVQRSRRQHHAGRVIDAGRSDPAERLEQQIRIVQHRRDAVAAEQLGEEPLHGRAVLDHVADA
jgi:hypothetical protein